MKPEKIETTATVSLDNTDKGWTVTEVVLDVKAKVPGADQAAFTKAANDAKANCPVSKALTGTEITLAVSG